MSNSNIHSNSPWTSPEMVARLSSTLPNDVLMVFADEELRRADENRLLDIGCGAGCNAIPLAQNGWDVLGLDLSVPMLEAAQQRSMQNGLTDRAQFRSASMDQLEVEEDSFDFIVAHGIWNQAESGSEFRKAVREAARAAKPGAPLFVYTFSRNTLPIQNQPVDGETFVYETYSGQLKCFLTENQLIAEMDAAGFKLDIGASITEYPQVPGKPKPAILEGIFRLKK